MSYRFPDEYRRQFRLQIGKALQHADYADQVVDVSFHAAEQAMERLMAIVDTADSRVGINAMPMAVQLLKFAAETAEENMRQVLTRLGGVQTVVEFGQGEG